MTARVSFREVCKRYGLTRRQVEYLIEKGGVRATGGGYGHERTFDEREVRVLETLRRLMAAGWKVEAARPIAREIAVLGRQNVRLPGNVIVTLPPSDEEGEVTV